MSFHSQHGEDLFINNFFENKNQGICIEIGAYDGVICSNSLFFEQKGWTALCIEPIPHVFKKCLTNRKYCYECCIGEHDLIDKEFTIFTVQEHQSAISSLAPDNRLVQQFSNIITDSSKINVTVRSLNSLLDELNFSKNIDFISIDTENTELDVLKGIDLNIYNVKLFVIENNYDEPFCEEYLKQFGYKKIHRLVVNDFYIKE